ncbi:RDM1 superfamily [Sesbania bispinosa]|nr:RDM1 superfamily [Sesbania bispinosa]
MLRHKCPVSFDHLLVSDSETESDDATTVDKGKRKRGRKMSTIQMEKSPRSNNNEKGKNKLSDDEANQVSTKLFKPKPKDGLVELAKKYQNHMKNIPIPRARLKDNVIVNWQGLANTLKTLYGQPLHYQTLMLCKQWDESRIGSEDEGKPLGAIIDWSNAENAIWNVEEIHRLSTSPIYLAKLWLTNPQYRFYVEEVLPYP